MDHDAVPREWRELPERLGRGFRVAFLAGVDAGKTSLLLLTLNATVGDGPVAVADLDVGQPELCPPTTFALAEVRSPSYRLSSANAVNIYPYGYSTPAYHPPRFALLVRRHLGHLPERGRVLMNLDGWVDGEQAALLKAEMVRALRPTDVVAIDAELPGELREACEEVGAEVHRVERPPTVHRRDREERRLARSMLYASALRGASIRTEPASGVTFYPPDSDNPIQDPERYLLETVRELDARSLELGLELPEGFGTEPDLGSAGIGLLSYLTDQGDALVGLALLLGFSRERNSVRLLTNRQGPIRHLRLGTVALRYRPAIEEVGTVKSLLPPL
ncbi:MAG: polynucleotide 5'-hydroxyl-kinase [Nitrososphaerota archaeon]